MTNNHRAYATSIMAGANPFRLEIKRALALPPVETGTGHARGDLDAVSTSSS